MTDPEQCPLCSERYEERTNLRIHLEVEHRKSEIVSVLLERDGQSTDPATTAETDAVLADRKPSA